MRSAVPKSLARLAATHRSSSISTSTSGGGAGLGVRLTWSKPGRFFSASMPLARSSFRMPSAVVKSFRRFASTQRSSMSSTLKSPWLESGAAGGSGRPSSHGAMAPLGAALAPPPLLKSPPPPPPPPPPPKGSRPVDPNGPSGVAAPACGSGATTTCWALFSSGSARSGPKTGAPSALTLVLPRRPKRFRSSLTSSAMTSYLQGAHVHVHVQGTLVCRAHAVPTPCPRHAHAMPTPCPCRAMPLLRPCMSARTRASG